MVIGVFVHGTAVNVKTGRGLESTTEFWVTSAMSHQFHTMATVRLYGGGLYVKKWVANGSQLSVAHALNAGALKKALPRLGVSVLIHRSILSDPSNACPLSWGKG